MTNFSTKRDVHRRETNRAIRKINEEYWANECAGRFYITQEQAWWWPLEDRSAYYYGVTIRLIDRANGYTEKHFYDSRHPDDLHTMIEDFRWRAEGLDGGSYDFRYYTQGGRTFKRPHSPHPEDAPLMFAAQNS